MKKTDHKNRTPDDLRKEVSDKRNALRNFRFGGAGSRSRNVREGRNLRKEIAQILTELKRRVLSSKKP